MATPAQVDPSRTALEYRQQSVRLKAVFAEIESRLRDFRFAGGTDADKLASFTDWVEFSILPTLTDTNAVALWRQYVSRAYAKGAIRSFDEVSLKQPRLSDADAVAVRMQFLRDFQKASEEREALLAAKSMQEVKAAADVLSAKLSRSVGDSLLRGLSQPETKRNLVREVDGVLGKVLTTARTEVVAAHAAGQLDGFRRMGVKQLGLLVEWQTAGDLHVCPRCRDMAGRTFDIEEADGLIPLHPLCRCAWTAAGVAGGTRGGSRLRRVRRR